MVLWSETLRSNQQASDQTSACSVKAHVASSAQARIPRHNNAWMVTHPYEQAFRPMVGFVGEEPPRIYHASCYCGRVQYDVRGDPASAKICHCSGCQLLHGAPFEWVAIYHKDNVRFQPASLKYLHFYNSETDKGWTSKEAANRELPVKVSCSHCRTPVADEGKHMWLAFCTLFGFTKEATIPKAFQPSCHLFYKQRCIDINDAKTKWEGQKKLSARYKEEKDWST